MGKGLTVLLLTCILFVSLIGAKKHHHHHRRHKAHLHTSLLKSSSIQTPQAAAEPAGAAKSSAKAEAPQDSGKQAPQDAGKMSAKQAQQDAPSAEGKVADQGQASAEAKDDNASDVLNKIKQLKSELSKNKAAAAQQQQHPPKQAEAEAEAEAEGDEEGAPEATPVDNSRIDIDTAMPYGELEPFGREDTAEELTEQSIRESDEMVDQLERAEVAEEKRSVFRALTRLRGAAITSFDGIARSQTGNIDQYNRVHKWRRTHPMHHLADEEGDVKKWAFPGRED